MCQCCKLLVNTVLYCCCCCLRPKTLYIYIIYIIHDVIQQVATLFFPFRWTFDNPGPRDFKTVKTVFFSVRYFSNNNNSFGSPVVKYEKIKNIYSRVTYQGRALNSSNYSRNIYPRKIITVLKFPIPVISKAQRTGI